MAAWAGLSHGLPAAGLRRMSRAPGRLRVCRPGGGPQGCPGGGMREKATCSPPLQGWGGAGQHPSRSDPVLSSPDTPPRQTLNPSGGLVAGTTASQGSGLESRGLGPQEQRRGERPGPGQASAGASGSLSPGGSGPATSPTGGLVPHQRSERQLTRVHRPWSEPCALSCSRPSSVPGPKARPRHGCWEAQAASRGGGGGRGGSWLAWRHQGAVLIQAAPLPPRSLFRGRFSSTFSRDQGLPGNAPWRQPSPARGSLPRAPRVSLSIVSCLKTADTQTPPPRAG